MEGDLSEQATQLNTREEYVAWEQRCDEFIESLEEQSRIKRPRLSISNRKSVTACIARLESLKNSVRGRFVHVGAGHGLRWRKIETAFESRILTGAVINSNYIEPRRFLEDASETGLERVQCIMQRYDSIKINTVFNGEFVAGDKRANKSIATRNYELYRCTDLRECAGHFALIKDLSRLVNSQINRYGHRKYFCDRCLHYFDSSAKLEIHTEDCGKLNDCAIRLPSEDDKWLSVRNHCRKERVPFVVYADLQCALEKTDKDPTSATYTYQHHNVFSIGYYVHCSYDSSLSDYRFRPDKDCIAWLAEELRQLAHTVQSTISANVPMADFTRDDWEKFNSASHCHVCEKPFTPDDTQVRDHCHLTGRYRGPAHSNCNLNYKDSRCIPVVFHNLFSYDAHFIIKEIASAYEGRVDLLLITKEKYISFTKHVDSTKIDCQPLNYADFRWVHNFDFTTIALDSPTGYILEGDLEYPQHLHDAHTDLPFCPTREKPPGKRDDKLLATLCDKQRYVIHYRNLQQCTRHSLRFAKIHRILQFAQSPWLRDYIELNTKFRTMDKNDFEKNLYKLMNNAVFGITMENVRDRVDVKLLTKWEGRYGAEAMIAKPNYHNRSVFSENLIAIELRKLEVKSDKSIYVSMCILDISKTCLYEFHHEYMAPLFREKCKIMCTDTDSLIYHIKCDDVYETIKRDIDRFDTSDYTVDNAYGIPLANKKVPGLMKDENNGAVVTEFVGLRTKMYASRVEGKKDAKKAKGVKSSVVAKSITFEDYACCLNDAIEMTRRQSCTRSKLHEEYTISETKIALSPHDDKRCIVSGSTDTLPWGHYRCK
ncbi:hypothetical protein ALC57_13224 [Trachymyrmex cornetzi]|uniref:DNA-directed DNA polymerase n=1 Tax=Trachymyrmex cornetzi TaxID=471704 RepID=A0A151IZR2_9HYME|nr:hypothetical protein ALC57_13224 [Trachymyrmex cornetzi]